MFTIYLSTGGTSRGHYVTIGYGATIAVRHIPQFPSIAMCQISKVPYGNRSCDGQCILLGVALHIHIVVFNPIIHNLLK